MQKTKRLLCTRPVSENIIQAAADNDIIIDMVSLIKTEPVIDDNLKKHIQGLASQKLTVVFTSMNAVEAVAKVISEKTDWKIYCIGITTNELVEKYFGNGRIAGTAKNASELADKIIADKVSAVTFFCGDIRRDELPQKLISHNISVEEIITYKTTETPQKIKEKYDGILFFSPSAVRSFFINNTIDNDTVFFAIGTTTAEELKVNGVKNILIADQAGKTDIVETAIKYLSVLTIKN